MSRCELDLGDVALDIEQAQAPRTRAQADAVSADIGCASADIP